MERSDKDSAKRNEKAIDDDSAAMKMLECTPRTPYDGANDSRRECWEKTPRSGDGRVRVIHCCQHHREQPRVRNAQRMQRDAKTNKEQSRTKTNRIQRTENRKQKRTNEWKRNEALPTKTNTSNQQRPSDDTEWFPEHEVSSLIGYRTKTSATVCTMYSATTHTYENFIE